MATAAPSKTSTKSSSPPRQFLDIALDHIQIPPDKTDRAHLDQAGMDELAASMSSVGLLQPIVVAPTSVLGFRYVLIAGERRLRAARQLKWDKIPALVVADADDEVDLCRATENLQRLCRATENLQRLDLNAIETALVVGQMLDDTTADILADQGAEGDVKHTVLVAAQIAAVKRIAGRMGKPERWVRDQLFLHDLDKTTRQLVIDGRLPVRHARELAKMADPEERADLAKRCAAHAKGGEYAWPFDLLKREVAKRYRTLSSVPWKLDAEFAGKPACTDCPQNSANKPGLFEHAAPAAGYSSFKEPAAGVCLNPGCFGAKSAAVTRAASTNARLTVSAAKVAKGKTPPDKPVKMPTTPDFVQPAKFKAAVADRVDDGT